MNNPHALILIGTVLITSGVTALLIWGLIKARDIVGEQEIINN